MTPRRLRARVALLLSVFAGACSRAKPERATLTVLLSGDILSLDANRRSETITDSVLFNVYQPLVGLDGKLNPQAALAERWENPTADRWRFHVRKNVRFHDGTLVTASLVRDALRAVKRDARLEASTFLRQIREIEAVSDDVLDLTTSEPRALLPSLYQVYITKPNLKGAFPPLVGTGPFKLRAWQQGGRVALDRWEGYWGKPAAFHEVVFVPVSDPRERFARLCRGEADIAYRISPEQAGAPLPPGVRILRGGGLTVYYLVFNVRSRPGNPLHDVRVREAFHRALNRQEMVDQAIGAPATQPVSPLVFGYNPRIALSRRDPVRARQLLTEAGFGGGFRIRLDFPATRLSTAQAIRKSLKEIGVELDLNALPRNAVHELAEAGKSDFYFTGWACSSGEASEFYEFCLHTRSDVAGHGNYGGYSNPRLDQIAEQNAAILDQLQRRSLLEEAADITMKELPILPLYVEGRIFGIRQGIEFAPPADGQVRLVELVEKKR